MKTLNLTTKARNLENTKKTGGLIKNTSFFVLSPFRVFVTAIFFGPLASWLASVLAFKPLALLSST